MTPEVVGRLARAQHAGGEGRRGTATDRIGQQHLPCRRCRGDFPGATVPGDHTPMMQIQHVFLAATVGSLA